MTSPFSSDCFTWLCALRCRACLIAAGTPEKGLIMRRIKKIFISREVIDEIAAKLGAICSDDEEKTMRSSIIQDLERGKDGESVAEEIASFMAHKSAERFTDMVNGMRYSDITQMIERIQDSDPIDAVRILQMMFLSHGMTAESEDLDILDICANIDTDIYEYFFDSFMQEESIDWFALESVVDHYNEDLAAKFS